MSFNQGKNKHVIIWIWKCGENVVAKNSLEVNFPWTPFEVLKKQQQQQQQWQQQQQQQQWPATTT